MVIKMESGIHEQLTVDDRGFSLIELLVAMSVATVVAMAGFSLFSSSNKSYLTQESVGEAQQNARVAMDTIARDIRAAGLGLPHTLFTLTIAGSTLDSPVTVQNNAAGPDVITLLGGGEYEIWIDSDGDCSDTDSNPSNNCDLPDPDDPMTGHPAGSMTIRVVGKTENVIDKLFSGGSFDSDRRYINIGGTFFVELSSATRSGRRATLTIKSPSKGLNRLYMDGTPVFVIRAVRYSIRTDLAGCSSVYPCLVRQDLAVGSDQVLAQGIEDIQFAYGIDLSPQDGQLDDTNGDGQFTDADFIDSPADELSIRAVRVNILAKTRNPDPDAVPRFSIPAVEDRPAGTGLDAYRRRLLTKVVRLRNPREG